MNCLVSGATGFIGRPLCQYLAEQGESFTALSLAGKPLADGTATRALDLSQPELDKLSLRDVDVVYHLAGIAHRQAEAASYRAINYEATLRLARLAASQGVRRFVFLSSVKAMGTAVSQVPRAENACSLPEDPYGLWKWRAECALREEFANTAMSIVIVRPALVYGGGAKGNLALLARGVKAGMPRPPPAGGRSMVAVSDLVNLLYLLGSGTPLGVQTWIVCDGESYSTRRIHDAMRSALGKGAGRSWLPARGWRLGCALLDIIAATGGESTFDKLFGTELYDNSAVLAATSWRPALRLEDEIPAMLGNIGVGSQ